MKLGNRLEWMAENLKAPGLPSGFQPVRPAPAPAHLRRRRHRTRFAHVPPGRGPPGVRRSSGAPSASASGSPRSASRSSPWAAGTTTTCESDLEAFAALHKTSGLNRCSDRPLAAQHVLPLPGRRFRAGFRSPHPRVATRVVRPVAHGQGHRAALPPPVKIFVMGANNWREERRVAARRQRARREFYLA